MGISADTFGSYRFSFGPGLSFKSWNTNISLKHKFFVREFKDSSNDYQDVISKAPYQLTFDTRLTGASLRSWWT